MTGNNLDTIGPAQPTLGGSKVEVIRSDTTEVAPIKALMADIRVLHSRIDILFANGAISSQRPIAAVDEAYFDSMIALNLRGMYFTVQRALPLMGHCGSIIFTASAAAHVDAVCWTVHAASKAAVRSLGRGFGAELA